jgi:hypothetical protein
MLAGGISANRRVGGAGRISRFPSGDRPAQSLARAALSDRRAGSIVGYTALCVAPASRIAHQSRNLRLRESGRGGAARAFSGRRNHRPAHHPRRTADPGRSGRHHCDPGAIEAVEALELSDMKTIALGLFCALAMLAQQINIESDQAADFSKFKTFAIRGSQLNSRNPALNSDLIRKKIDADIQRGPRSQGPDIRGHRPVRSQRPLHPGRGAPSGSRGVSRRLARLGHKQS